MVITYHCYVYTNRIKILNDFIYLFIVCVVRFTIEDTHLFGISRNKCEYLCILFTTITGKNHKQTRMKNARSKYIALLLFPHEMQNVEYRYTQPLPICRQIYPILALVNVCYHRCLLPRTLLYLEQISHFQHYYSSP